MAQSQVTAPELGDAGGSALWESRGAVDEAPLDLWSRPPTVPLTQLSTTIAQAPARTDIGQVLAAWRAALRQLEEHIEASPMRPVNRAEIDRLRAEYHRLFTQAAK
jgi:hypothetical protein